MSKKEILKNLLEGTAGALADDIFGEEGSSTHADEHINSEFTRARTCAGTKAAAISLPFSIAYSSDLAASFSPHVSKCFRCLVIAS